MGKYAFPTMLTQLTEGQNASRFHLQTVEYLQLHKFLFQLLIYFDKRATLANYTPIITDGQQLSYESTQRRNMFFLQHHDPSISIQGHWVKVKEWYAHQFVTKYENPHSTFCESR